MTCTCQDFGEGISHLPVVVSDQDSRRSIGALSTVRTILRSPDGTCIKIACLMSRRNRFHTHDGPLRHNSQCSLLGPLLGVSARRGRIPGTGKALREALAACEAFAL